MTARELAGVLVDQLQRILNDGDLQNLHCEALGFNVYCQRLKNGEVSEESSPLTLPKFRTAYEKDGTSGLLSQLKFHLQGQHAHRNLNRDNEKDQLALADLSYPAEWYPITRSIQRTIHLHVGPTNSGKTYHALKRLEQAKSGLYAGPLRLLAYEVYTRLNAKGIKCDLLTGDEMHVDEDKESSMTSCTVEMVPTGRHFEVAVIDEIQMLANKERGWAWTAALLGLKASEVHLCGEERTVPLLRELAVSMGDDLVIHNYKRLSPLKAMTTSLNGDLGNLRKGDCVITFSKRDLHSIKGQIERKTNKNVAIVYGSLPPESRAQQARLFNDPSNDYDYLVATDAIGMGLNLSIKRIIFDTTYKFNGKTQERISIPDLKQIAGRAGRYRVAPQDTTAPEVQKLTEGSSDEVAADMQEQEKNVKPSESITKVITGKAEATNTSATKDKDTNPGTTGFVTSLERMDLKHVQLALKEEADPIMAAGIAPPDNVVTAFANYFPPDTAFSYILYRLHELCSTKSRYFLCNPRDPLKIAQALDTIPNLTIQDRLIFCAAPSNAGNAESYQIIRGMARCVAENKSGALLDIEGLNLELLDTPDTVTNSELLTQFEALHKALILYTWLSYRFVGVFTSRDMAFHVKELVEARINKLLSNESLAEKLRQQRQKYTKYAAKREEKYRQRMEKMEAARNANAQNEDYDAEEEFIEVGNDEADIFDENLAHPERLVPPEADRDESYFSSEEIDSVPQISHDKHLNIVEEEDLGPTIVQEISTDSSEHVAANTSYDDTLQKQPSEDQSAAKTGLSSIHTTKLSNEDGPISDGPPPHEPDGSQADILEIEHTPESASSPPPPETDSPAGRAEQSV